MLAQSPPDRYLTFCRRLEHDMIKETTRHAHHGDMQMKTGDCDVVILCGGLGTRLRSVVGDRPKPMADIGGKPFVRLLVEHIASYGLDRFILSVGYKAGMIGDYFRAGNLPVKVEIAVESEPMGTAGGLRNSRALIRADTALVLNGDSFCRVDYAAMIEAHLDRNACATIAVVPTENAAEFGSIRAAKDGRITAFEEKKGGGGGLINAGVYVFRKTAIDAMPSRIPLSLEKDVFPGLTSGILLSFPVSGPLYDIGTPAGYARAQSDLPGIMATK